MTSTLGACALNSACTSLSLCAIKPEPERLPSILSFVQFQPDGSYLQDDPAKLIRQLLDQIEALAETARQIKLAVGRNGHRAKEARDIVEAIRPGVD